MFAVKTRTQECTPPLPNLNRGERGRVGATACMLATTMLCSNNTFACKNGDCVYLEDFIQEMLQHHD